MIFWGVEVKSGQHVLVQPGNEMLLHLSQACLGGIKKDKGSEYVRLYAKKNGQKFILGILSAEKFPHLNFDVVFEDDFELSHDGKNESVHFAGYKAQNPMDEEEIESDDSDGERVPMKALDNGTSQKKEDKPASEKIIAPSKPEAAAGKSKVKIVEPNKDDKQSEDSDDSEDSDENDSGDSDSDEDVEGSDDDSSDEDGEDDESDEETPEKPVTSKKRTAEASTKTPGPDKKAKFVTPVKNDGKKPVPHVATPYPSKQAGKLPANNDKPKQQTPKSSGSFACNSCSRSFGSEQALQSHSKAKHAAK